MKVFREFLFHLAVTLPCMLLIGLPAFIAGYAWWWLMGAFMRGFMVAHEESKP